MRSSKMCLNLKLLYFGFFGIFYYHTYLSSNYGKPRGDWAIFFLRNIILSDCKNNKKKKNSLLCLTIIYLSINIC